MTEKEIRAYMEQMEEEAAAALASGQLILDLLAEMAVVLTAGSGSVTVHRKGKIICRRQIVHSGGLRK